MVIRLLGVSLLELCQSWCSGRYAVGLGLGLVIAIGLVSVVLWMLPGLAVSRLWVRCGADQVKGFIGAG